MVGDVVCKINVIIFLLIDVPDSTGKAETCEENLRSNRENGEGYEEASKQKEGE